MTHASRHAPLQACLLILLASAFIALSTLFAKALGRGTFGPWDLGGTLHPLQISHGRFLFALLAVSTLWLTLRRRTQGVHWRLHAARSGIGWLGVSSMFAAAAFIPLADATAISFLNPVFCMIFAIPLLGEKVGPIRWGAAGIALLGAAILLRPSAAGVQPAALLALAAAILFGIELICIKILSGREPPLQILLINNMIGCAIASVAVLTVWQPPNPAQWLALAGVGLAMIAAQACYVNAMARADASFVAPFSYATLVFAALWDLAIFDVWPDKVSYLGITIILAGAFLLAWREARLKSRL